MWVAYQGLTVEGWQGAEGCGCALGSVSCSANTVQPGRLGPFLLIFLFHWCGGPWGLTLASAGDAWVWLELFQAAHASAAGAAGLAASPAAQQFSAASSTALPAKPSSHTQPPPHPHTTPHLLDFVYGVVPREEAPALLARLLLQRSEGQQCIGTNGQYKHTASEQR